METYNIWGDKMPLSDENITNDENKFAGTLIPYLVEEDDEKIEKRGAIIILPGGGYSFCSSNEGERFGRWLNFFGINAFELKYRVAPYKFPAPLMDAKRAIRYVRHNADKFNIDPKKVGIAGFSAGGHLAGLVSQYFDKFEHEPLDEIDKISAKPDLQILSYPVISFCEDFKHDGCVKNLAGNDTELIKTLSLEKNIREDMPKTFIWHTAMDNTVSVKNSIEYALALKDKNVPFYLHIFQNGLHGLCLAEQIEGTKEWTHLLKVLLKDEGFVTWQSYRFL